MRPNDPGATSEKYVALQSIAEQITTLNSELASTRHFNIPTKESDQRKNILSAWIDSASKFVNHVKKVYAYHEGQIQALGTESVINEAHDEQLYNEYLTKILAANYLIARKAMQDNFATTTELGFKTSEIDAMINDECPQRSH